MKIGYEPDVENVLIGEPEIRQPPPQLCGSGTTAIECQLGPHLQQPRHRVEVYGSRFPLATYDVNFTQARHHIDPGLIRIDQFAPPHNTLGSQSSGRHYRRDR
jgi:hypothetical protein